MLSEQRSFDIAIIGGSFAGLSAALLLGNALRRVAIVDDGHRRNQSVTVSLNVPGYNQRSPDTLIQAMRDDVSQFDSVEQMTARVIDIQQQAMQFRLQLNNGQVISSRKIIFATGVLDQLPAIAGTDAFWPENIFHCPYCIAYTLRDQPLAVYNRKEDAYVMALIIRKWSKDFVLLTDNSDVLTSAQRQQLQQLGVKLCDKAVDHFDGEPGKVINVHFDDGSVLARRGVFMHLPFQLQSLNLINQLACECDEQGLIVVDECFETTVPGAYAIGDMVTMVQKVTTAIASGSAAAFFVDHALSEALIL